MNDNLDMHDEDERDEITENSAATETTVAPVFELSEDQAGAITVIENFLEDERKEFKLGGFGGTGKTTVIKALLDRLKEQQHYTVLSAFTGKACHVLHKKGLPQAQTLHSLIYDCEPLKGGGILFHKKIKLDLSPSLIIVDESSMLSTELYKDLTSFGVKCLFVGDPGQLEPVGDNPNLMAKPDLVLSKIHRQAAESPIISFADKVRKGGQIVQQSQPGLTVTTKAGFRIPDCLNFDQVICAKNKTRTEINARVRSFQGKQPKTLVEGEKIIVLRNNRDYMVFNGMILTVEEIESANDNYWLCNCVDETGKEYNELPIWREPFVLGEMPKEFVIPRKSAFNRESTYLVYADYAYCITCHKSQGSEWDKVLVWHEFMPPKIWSMSRWSYTAITRAAKELTYCL